MLISVYRGETREKSERCGSMHFVVAPHPGEEVEFGNSFHTVLGIWHLPDSRFAGPKLGVLVSERLALQPAHDFVQKRTIASSVA